jgi:Tfp pilus assembly ATPase PilU
MTNREYDMVDLLTLVTLERAEGLSLHVGQQPVVHLWGEPHPIDGPSITPENAESLLRSLATTRQVREFREHGTAEFIYIFQNSTRFRVQARVQDDLVQLELQRWTA